MRDALQARGVSPGDRVGIYLPKTVDCAAALLGALKAGAAYVPVDPGSPPARAAYILHDCAVRLVVTESTLAPALETQLKELGAHPDLVVLETVGGGRGLSAWL